MVLYIDFETLDPGIQNKLGPAFPWGEVTMLGAAVKENNGETIYLDFLRFPELQDECLRLLREHDTWVAHNATYEGQAARMMGITEEELRSKTIYCTQVGGKLYNNLLPSYSLNALSEKLLGKTKLKDEVVDEAVKLGLIKPLKSYYGKPGTKAYESAHSRAGNELWAVLGRLQLLSDVVADYAKRDVDLCAELHKFYLQSDEPYREFCKLINVVVEMRMKGIRIDVDATRKLRREVTAKLLLAERALFNTCGVFNYESNPEITAWAEALGYPPIADLQGKPGYGVNWIRKNSHDERVRFFGECKRYNKALGFCESFLKYERGGRLHPELNILEARTGRFSSKNPNIQQVPSRDEELGPKFRALFLPDKRRLMYGADFASQESRLQVHYAELIGDESGKVLAEQYRNDPDFDLHSVVASMAGISRREAKTVNLGLSYGMGLAKLAGQLGVDDDIAKKVKAKYTKKVPYLQALSRYAQRVGEQNGFLITLGGRKSYMEKGFEYKALNKLIQGGAFDQTAAAMMKAYYEYEITPLACVHDELLFSSDGIGFGVDQVHDIMEHAVKLTVPCKTDVKVGNNWAEVH